MTECSVTGCSKVAEKRGWCGMHYSRWRRTGDLATTRKLPNGHIDRYISEFVLPYDGDECLIWPYARNSHGYANSGKGTVSRLVCIAVHGAPPTPEHHAAHSCGRGSAGCVSPGHMSWKTPVENNADKEVHGTVNKGERNGNAKLTNAQVEEIRGLLDIHTDSAIAAQFGVTAGAIWNIRTGRGWSSACLATVYGPPPGH